MKHILRSISALLVFASSFSLAQAANFDYKLLETFPGFFKAGDPLSDLPLLLTSLYNLGIWLVGISALFMIVVGGFMYIASAGNKSTAGSAKSIITDALTGLVVALASWLFLYVINPDLVEINLSLVSVNPGADGTGFESALNMKVASSSDAMQADGTYPVTDQKLPKGCDAYKDIFQKVSASTGVDACELEALAATETSCNPTLSRYNTNGTQDCGIMQINSVNFKGNTCQDFKNSVELSMQTAAKLYVGNYTFHNVINNRKYTAGSAISNKFKESQKIRDRYAAYNGGSKALEKSGSCTDNMRNAYDNQYLKYDCPINAGGYAVVPRNTSRFLNFYSKCKNVSIYK